MAKSDENIESNDCKRDGSKSDRDEKYVEHSDDLGREEIIHFSLSWIFSRISGEVDNILSVVAEKKYRKMSMIYKKKRFMFYNGKCYSLLHIEGTF